MEAQVAISLKPAHLKRYKDIVRLLFKYGRGDLASRAALYEDLTEAERLSAGESAPKAEELARDLERLGPSFVKIGQLLSTRSDLLSPPYLEALSRLQDAVEPFSLEKIEQIVTSELGIRISKAFAEFEDVPVAAASLGQVHRARLRDGRLVAVKVQRPGIWEEVLEDLGAFAEVVDRHSEPGAPGNPGVCSEAAGARQQGLRSGGRQPVARSGGRNRRETADRGLTQDRQPRGSGSGARRTDRRRGATHAGPDVLPDPGLSGPGDPLLPRRRRRRDRPRRLHRRQRPEASAPAGPQQSAGTRRKASAGSRRLAPSD